MKLKEMLWNSIVHFFTALYPHLKENEKCSSKKTTF
jgi:hypothetical protein